MLQYNLRSTDDFDRKIGQFPAGTTFLYRGIQPDSPPAHGIDAQIRASLAKHKMVVVSK